MAARRKRVAEASRRPFHASPFTKAHLLYAEVDPLEPPLRGLQPPALRYVLGEAAVPRAEAAIKGLAAEERGSGQARCKRGAVV